MAVEYVAVNVLAFTLAVVSALISMAKDIHSQSLPLPKFPMSAFDLGYSLKTCSAAGRMTPHFVEEAIPGDIAHIRTDLFMRLDPLTFPIMHKVKIRQNFFFVPTRLILGDALNEEFFSCKDMSAKLPMLEYNEAVLLSNNVLGRNSIFDQLECQPVVPAGGGTRKFYVRNPLPFLMLNKIWADWYADEIFDSSALTNLENALLAYQAAGLNGKVTDNLFLLQARKVSYSKDRFTSAQPDAQRVGEVYVMNPLEVARIDGQDIVSGSLQLKGGTGVKESIVYDDGTADSRAVRSTLTIDELWDEMVVQRFLNSMNEFGNELEGGKDYQ